ncbi:MAG: TOPRIM nucleotidyl transferase/hydrolase domain-containing protein [Acidimicrobiia bacterium]
MPAVVTESPATSAASLLETVRVSGFRTLRDAVFSPGPLSALVGEPGVGKSNLLASIRSALDLEGAPLTHQDMARATTIPIKIEIATSAGTRVTVEGRPPDVSVTASGTLPPVLYMPARLRAGRIIDAGAEASPQARLARELVEKTIQDAARRRQRSSEPPGSTEAAHGLVAATEAWEGEGLSGVIVLVEEPELFLTPQTQRYLYRQLRHLAEMGNQILYSTHSPSFLNVARLHELVLTEHDPATGTRLVQPAPLPASDEFRVYSEFDATRSEMFLSRAAVLVEGQTERLALPFVFRALGHDPDREGISIIECGGKPNIPLIARVAMAAGIPFVAVHDRDAEAGEKPIQSERALNDMIGEIAGQNRFELAPDFEGVAGLRGHVRKPARAWKSFATLTAEEAPELLAQIVTRAVELARRGG